jgi:hypothetical protein
VYRLAGPVELGLERKLDAAVRQIELVGLHEQDPTGILDQRGRTTDPS